MQGKKDGANRYACGTSALIRYRLEDWPSTTTEMFRLARKLETQVQKFRGRPNAGNLVKSALWSKGFEMSNATI